MTKKDWDYIARLEKAIKKKYGPEAVINPKAFWTDEKEKEYLKQIKEIYNQEKTREEEVEKVEKDGFLIPKNLINKKSKRKCPTCGVYSFDKKDDLYMNKYECCSKCFVQWVEDREERWLNGWRPNKNKD
tara:strand:- start:341 stop:730 length:390 start_codon:yes stop_codon:yes gene_type:complete